MCEPYLNFYFSAFRDWWRDDFNWWRLGGGEVVGAEVTFGGETSW